MKTFTLALLSCLGGVLLFGAVLEGALRWGIIENPQHDRLQIHGKATHARYRLLILGDSFFIKTTAVAQSLARDLAGHDVAVLNAAISGAGPFEYLAQLKTAGPRLKPDVVLLSYYAGNDLTNVQYHPQFNPKKSGIGIDSRTSRSLAHDWYLYHYVLQKVRRLLLLFYHFDYEQASVAGVAPDLIEDAKQLRINPWLVKLALHENNYLVENILMESDENKKAWKKVSELLAEIHNICHSLGSRLIVVIFPGTVQINTSHFEFFKNLTFHIDPRTLESTRPQRLIMDFCSARKVACLDLLPTFKARKDEELYRDKDDHLNEQGNRLAADLIREFLLKNTAIGLDKTGQRE